MPVKKNECQLIIINNHNYNTDSGVVHSCLNTPFDFRRSKYKRLIKNLKNYKKIIKKL